MTLIPLKPFETSTANQAINLYKDIFGDRWRDFMKVNMDLTEDQERGLADMMIAAVKNKRPVKEIEIDRFLRFETDNLTQIL